MARSKFRRAPLFENLESRQLLSTGVSGQGPTNQEQYMLQLLNEARTNPSAISQYISQHVTPDIQATINYYNVNLPATLQKLGTSTPQPPLAWNGQLSQAAQGHSQDMASNQYQSHTGSDGTSPQQRMQQAGYNGITSSGENVYAYSSSVDQAMEAFLLDWGVPDDGHRDNIQQPGVSAQNAYRDVGIGIANAGPGSKVGPMTITQDFGSQANEQAQVVGVAYNDPNNTGFYAPGQGVGNVQVTAVNTATGQSSSTQTWGSGGYALSLAPGQYQLTASLNNQVIQTVNINVGSVNVEQDFVLTNPWQGGQAASAAAVARPTVSITPQSIGTVATPPTVAVPTAFTQAGAIATLSQATTAPAKINPSPAFSWRWTSWSASVG